MGAFISAIESCWKSLFSVMCLMMVVIYMSSVAFLQFIANQVNILENEDLSKWFGGMSRTMLTMFQCLFSGVSWDEVVRPMMLDVTPVLGILFCCYIALGVLAMFNLFTGIFVENVMKALVDDRDRMLANRIKDLFVQDEGSHNVSCEEFTKKMESAAMRDYFKTLGVTNSEASALFKLLDCDGSGVVSAEEIVTGCMNMRGVAKGLDMCVLVHEVSCVREAVGCLQDQMEALTGFMDTQSDSPSEAPEFTGP